MLPYIVASVILLVFAYKVLGFKFFIIVRAGTVVILDRGQQFFKELKPGFHWIVPYYDCPRRVHWQHNTTQRGHDRIVKYESDEILTTETPFELPYTDFYTEDNFTVGVQMHFTYQIDDAQAAVSVPNLHQHMETELTSRLAEVMRRTKCAALDKVLIENKMKSENGAKAWQDYGLHIIRCRVFDLVQPQQMTSTNTDAVIKNTQYQTDIESMALANKHADAQLDHDLKLVGKRSELTVAEIKATQCAEAAHDEYRLRRRKTELQLELDHLADYVKIVKASGLTPDFFIQLMDKEALHKLADNSGGDGGGVQGDNNTGGGGGAGCSRVTTIYVPSTLGTTALLPAFDNNNNNKNINSDSSVHQ